jgi:hypothetical protein
MGIRVVVSVCVVALLMVSRGLAQNCYVCASASNGSTVSLEGCSVGGGDVRLYGSAVNNSSVQGVAVARGPVQVLAVGQAANRSSVDVRALGEAEWPNCQRLQVIGSGNLGSSVRAVGQVRGQQGGCLPTPAFAPCQPMTYPQAEALGGAFSQAWAHAR